MTDRRILVVAADGDPDAAAVAAALERAGTEPVRLAAADLPLRSTPTVRIDPALSGRLALPDLDLDLADVGAVWWSGQLPSGVPAELSAWEREFAIEELEQAYRGLWAALDCAWMSRPDRLRAAGWTTGQLQRASRLGFAVPRSVVTTSPDSAFEFYAAVGGRAVRRELVDPRTVLAGFRVHHPDGPPPDPAALVRTHPLGDDDLVALGTLRTTPAYLQEELAGRPVRAVVVGEEVLAADPLPAAVAGRCLAFARSYGLALVALDLLAGAGPYAFLGAHPGRGATEPGAADAAAAELLRGARG